MSASPRWLSEAAAMCARAARPGMGIATDRTVENKRLYFRFLDSFSNGGARDVRNAASGFFAADAKISASHPINEARDGDGYFEDVIIPIAAAFAGMTRQNYIVIGGAYQGAEWVTSTGYFYGHFTQPLFGIPPSGKTAFLRFGEFHRMDGCQVVETQIYLGLAELVIALGLWHLNASNGYEGVVPGPATHDGIVMGPSDPTTSRASADLVEDMLLRLTSDDCAWRPYWDDRMVWYGPGGLGTYATTDAFADFQRPFELTFDGWGDGQNEGIQGVGSSCKAGDGSYVFLSGWPQITGVQVKPFLGIPPTGRRVFMRDCDWWRCAGGKIVENWCMLDIPHLLLQLGFDLLAEVESAQ